MEYLITVISPCYNAEKTLKRCIESIINQSIGFENIELILYDDASADNTKKIIDSYSRKYKNIIPIFSNSNNGPGSGKDLGVSRSSGKYIMFIDSDDEYDGEMCEHLVNEINDDVDIVSCNHKIIDGDSSEIYYYKLTNDYNLKNKSLLTHDELIYLPSFMVVDKIFKRDIIIKNNIKFTSIRNGEDQIFLMHYLLFSKNLIHLNNYVGYIIHKQSNSISNSQTVDDLFSYLFVCKKIKKLYGDTEADIPKLVESRIKLFIGVLYLKDILINYDKSLLYDALNSLADFEKEISFDRNLGVLNSISNFFIKNKHFPFVIFYSKILYNIRKSRLLLRIYRVFIR